MAGIYHPSRGGVRGGKDQFNWDDVKTDKDRENYLGHSLMVPVGKWQEGKDLVWYTREKQLNESEAERKRKQEIKSMKDIEARAMAAALGHKSFSTGTTSLTAKELQEVLSRGQTSHNEGDRVEGMGFKKSFSKSKQPKYGTQFEGEANNYVEEMKSEKKKKKKKEKKKKKRRHSSASDNSDDYVEIKRSYTSRSRIDTNERDREDSDRLLKHHRRSTSENERENSRKDFNSRKTDKYRYSSHTSRDYEYQRRSNYRRKHESPG